MTERRKSIAAALLLAVLSAGALLLGGCESKPAEPVFDNVFDPEGPLLGDPLFVFATRNDTSIVVSWAQRQGFSIALYEVSHSTSYGSGYELFSTVLHTDATSGRTYFVDPAPTTEHYFKVLALTADDDYAFISYQKPGSFVTPPHVVLGNDKGTSPTRYLPVSVTVANGDSILVADNVEFLGAQRLPVEEYDTPLDLVWDLGPAEANGGFRHVFVRAVGSPAEDVTFGDSIKIDFRPAFTVLDKPATVATIAVDLAVPIEGVLQMRFATAAEDLATRAWLAPAEILSGFELQDTLNPQVIYGEFEGDFGFTSPVIEYAVAGDPLTGATFDVDLGSAPVSLNPVVTLTCTARATHMRFSEGQDFTLVPWLPYEAAPTFALSAGVGSKTIYGQFHNEFTDSPVSTATVEYIQQEVAVGFLAPTPDRNMTAGAPFRIAGWAAAAGTSVDSVKVELGDGLGFVAATGTEDWMYDWDVPEAEEDTPLILRVRAWAGADSVTAQTGVTIRS